jgi:hypothetical protein
MALTFANLIADWNRSTGSAESSLGVSVVDGVNQALDYVSSMHEWRGLVRSAVDLATVADQSYIDLPAACQKIISIQYSDGNWRAVQFVTQERLAEWRTTNQSSAAYSGTYIGATSWAVGTTGATPRLDVYPNISSTSSDTFQITYRARLLMEATDTAADTSVIDVPPYLESLVRSVVRVFAKGIEEEDDGSLWARLEELEMSTMLARIKVADGGLQPSIGRMIGGASQYAARRQSDTDEQLAEPS